MTDAARPDVVPDIARFAVHGGRVDAARAAYPGVAEWIDLSTGISPWAYPAAVPHAALAQLPDPEQLAGLEAAAAGAFGVAAAHVVAVPGTDIALRLLGRLIGGEAAIVGPGYSGHAAMWDGRAEAIGFDDLAPAARRHDTVVLARPNNPDGRVIDGDAIAFAAGAIAERGGWLIVDEAFVDATPHLSLADRGWERLVVLRSFGKFFGLAGVRLGFVVAPPAIAAPLRHLLGDWPVCGPAIAIGTLAYADRAWQMVQRERLGIAARRFDALLGAAGLEPIGGTALFRLVETARRDELFNHLARAGILARPFADMPLRLRLGLPGTTAAWQRVSIALHDWSKP